MKKLILMIAVCGFLYSTNVSAQTDQNTNPGQTTTPQDNQDWQQSKDGYWMGRDKTMYRFDEKSNLMMSRDGKTWEPAKENRWQDQQGRWLRYQDNRLMWSEDEGGTWSNVPQSGWTGSDGTYYRIDKNGELWVRKGKGTRGDEESKSK